MSDASVTPEPSMDEILQKIQRIIADDEKPESAPAPTPPRSAEILTLTEAVGEGGTVRRLTPVEPSSEPTVENPAPSAAAPHRGGCLGSRAAASAGRAAHFGCRGHRLRSARRDPARSAARRGVPDGAPGAYP